MAAHWLETAILELALDGIHLWELRAELPGRDEALRRATHDLVRSNRADLSRSIGGDDVAKADALAYIGDERNWLNLTVAPWPERDEICELWITEAGTEALRDWRGHRLGDLGSPWVVESLANGLSLSARVLGAVDLANADVRALVPARVPQKTLLAVPDIRHGVGLSRGASTALLLALLRGRAGAILVVEDELARAGDRIHEANGHAMLCEDEVYRWADVADVEAVESVLAQSAGYPLNAFVVEGPAELPRQLPRHALAELAAATAEIVVGAFDAEGYVLCTLGSAQYDDPNYLAPDIAAEIRQTCAALLAETSDEDVYWRTSEIDGLAGWSIPDVPGRLFVIWGRLADLWELYPERREAAAQVMRDAARDYLAVGSQAEFDRFLDAWSERLGAA